jgi:hypothetical protein
MRIQMKYNNKVQEIRTEVIDSKKYALRFVSITKAKNEA